MIRYAGFPLLVTAVLCCYVSDSACAQETLQELMNPETGQPNGPLVVPGETGNGAADPAPLPPPEVPEEFDSTAEAAPMTGSVTGDACPDRCPGGLGGSSGPGPVGRYWQYRLKPWLQATHWGYAEYFHERPFGTYAQANLQMQICNGVVHRMVLYQYDFFDGTDVPASRLKPRGRDQLREMVSLVESTGQPLLIERSPHNPQLDQLRRQAVLRELREELQYPAPDEMVVVGKPAAFGLLRGGVLPLRSEPEANYYNLLRQTEDRGREAIIRRSLGGSASSGR